MTINDMAASEPHFSTPEDYRSSVAGSVRAARRAGT